MFIIGSFLVLHWYWYCIVLQYQWSSIVLVLYGLQKCHYCSPLIEADKINERKSYMMDLNLYREEFAYPSNQISRQILKTLLYLLIIATTQSAHTNNFDFNAYFCQCQFAEMFFFYLCLFFLLSSTCL